MSDTTVDARVFTLHVCLHVEVADLPASQRDLTLEVHSTARVRDIIDALVGRFRLAPDPEYGLYRELARSGDALSSKPGSGYLPQEAFVLNCGLFDGVGLSLRNRLASPAPLLSVDFDHGTTTLTNAAAKKDALISQLAARGIYCRPYTTFERHVNSRGVSYTVAIPHDGCPQEVSDAITQYNRLVARIPSSQQDVDTKVTAIAKEPSLTNARKAVAGAQAQAAKELVALKPSAHDTLLSRMRALDALTTQPTGPCKANSKDLVSLLQPNCVSRYSKRATDMQHDLRLWLLFLELVPIVFKFVNALLPRRGYATVMAGKEAEAKAEGEKRRARAKIDTELDRERYQRQERLEMELESALEEASRREQARGKEKVLGRRIWERFEAMKQGQRAARKSGINSGSLGDPSDRTATDVSWGEFDRYHHGQDRVDSEDFLEN